MDIEINNKLEKALNNIKPSQMFIMSDKIVHNMSKNQLLSEHGFLDFFEVNVERLSFDKWDTDYEEQLNVFLEKDTDKKLLFAFTNWPDTEQAEIVYVESIKGIQLNPAHIISSELINIKNAMGSGFSVGFDTVKLIDKGLQKLPLQLKQIKLVDGRTLIVADTDSKFALPADPRGDK